MRLRARNARAFYARLLRLALTLLCVSATSGAWAQVPMCGPDGQSIAAPPIVMPQRDVKLTADKPCDDRRTGLDAAPDPTSPERGTTPPPVERMLPVSSLLLIGPPSLRLDRAALDASQARMGVISLIYRPPRSA